MEFIQPKCDGLEPRYIRHDCSFAYFHPNPVFRKVFLSRLHCALSLLDARQYDGILDIGVGCGYLLPSLSCYGELIGIEVNELHLGRAIQLCRENRVEADLKLASITDIPFKNNTFELVTAISVLEHIQDLDKAMSEIKRVMKVGGVLIVGLPIERFLVNSLFNAMARLQPDYAENKKKYKKNEYQDVHVSDFKRVRENLARYFKFERIRRLPFNWSPDFCSIYEAYRCIKIDDE